MEDPPIALFEGDGRDVLVGESERLGLVGELSGIYTGEAEGFPVFLGERVELRCYGVAGSGGWGEDADDGGV